MRGPTVLMFPGASLMDIRATPAGDIRIGCPGCGVELTLVAEAAPHTGHVAIQHADDCPTHRRIRAAMRAYERDVVRYG